MSKFGPGGKYWNQVEFYAVARFCHPCKAMTMKPMVDVFQKFIYLPCLGFGDIAALVDEWPRYLVRADGFPIDGDILAYWASNEKTLPNWAALAKRVLTHHRGFDFLPPYEQNFRLRFCCGQ